MDKQPKIGIMTFHAAHNNGAALQAYALQQSLSLLGADAELIRYFDMHNEKRAVHHSHLYNFFHNPTFLFNLLFNFRRTLKLRGKSVLTDRAFQNFHKQFLITSNEPYYSYNDLIEANTRYNGFVTGSDMVWTPIGQNLPAYFLQFADNGKRFSYSPSLTGTQKFSEEQHSRIQKYIREMDIISCREREGVDYVQKNVEKEATLTLDPTLLFDKLSWASHLNLSIDKKSDPYILCYMFDELSKVHKKNISSYAKKFGYQIRYVPMTMAQREYEIDHGYICGYGPREFVELFLNASFIITNTYHGLMFSLISETPFALIHRRSNNQWKSNEERMSNILDLLNLSVRYIDANTSIPDSFFELDYHVINQIIERERKKSLSFLSKIVEAASCQKLSDRPQIHHVSELSTKDCTGCGLCSSTCPFSAISMINDDEGFRIPLVNTDICKQCHKCVSICPSINEKPYSHLPIAAYAAVSKDCLVSDSASGGAFVTIARYFIEILNGVVYGAVFDDNLHCVHVRASTMEDVKKMQNSKYVQSNIEVTYEHIKEDLHSGRHVLFTGTPCQVASVLSYMGGPSDLLFTVSLICHGVPSPGYWSKYIDETYKGKLKEFKFRNRNNRSVGKTSFVGTALLSDNKELQIRHSDDVFYRTFLRNLSFRMSCYYCKYAKPERIGDFTIGDFDSESNYSEFLPNNAKSSIMINTESGKELWAKINAELEYIPINYDLEASYNNQLRIPSEMPEGRHDIYSDLNKMTWDAFVNKYKSI